MSDPRGRLRLVGLVGGCTSAGLHATNGCERNADPGEVCWCLHWQALGSCLRTRPVLESARIASAFLARPASQSRVGRGPLRPVLKHGPRSLTCARAIGRTKPKCAVKAKDALASEGRSLTGAAPALGIDLASCRAARAYTLGPERW